jgi:hypothetical protein
MRRLAVLVLLACLAVAGCAGPAKDSDNDNRFGGFYGGVSGGAAP